MSKCLNTSLTRSTDHYATIVNCQFNQNKNKKFSKVNIGSNMVIKKKKNSSYKMWEELFLLNNWGHDKDNTGNYCGKIQSCFLGGLIKR